MCVGSSGPFKQAVGGMMSATPPSDEIQHAGQTIGAGTEAEASPAVSGSRSRTWAHGVPAMRLQRTRWRLSGRPATAAEAAEGVAESSAGGSPPSTFPPHMRLIRASVGVSLLVLAWAGALAAYMLAQAAFAPLARQKLLMILAPRLAVGLGACLLAIVVATLLIVGAFSLSLAVHPNDPELEPSAGAAEVEQ